MTLKTVPVTGTLYNPDGSVAQNAAVVATLTTVDTDGGVVVPSSVSTTTNSSGVFTLNLWPNSRGVNGSQYMVRAQMPGALPGVLIMNLRITVPDSDPTVPVPISVITNRTGPDALSDAKAAMLAAQAFAAQSAGAGASATAAAASATAAAGSALSVAFLYPGQSATAPTTRPDGTAIQNGDRYNNSTDGTEYIRVNGAWTNAASSAAAAAGSAAAAATSQASASGSASAASASATTASNYAAASATSAKFFNTIALGNAGVADAATFGVIAGGSDGLPRPSVYRRESAGVSTALYSILPASEYDALLPTIGGVNPVWGVNDDRGNTAIEVATDGTTTASNLVALQLNGMDRRFNLRPTSLGNFDAELMVFINEGQSNANGQVPGVTTTVEYDNIGFPPQSTAPGAYVDLTSQNCSTAGVAEPPMFGAIAYIKKLLQQENGLSPTDIAFQLLAADNSQGSTTIGAHVKGSQYYGYGTSQATSAVTIAGTQNRSVAHGGIFWNQGEADAATALATYQAALIQLATDYNTDLKAITGQTKNITLIAAQTTSTAANRNIALAQLAAANASALVKLCCPMYVFDFMSDGIHVISRHDYWMGAYYGLVWKRLWVDLLTWKPTQPVSKVTSGKITYVTFDCMVQPLVLDTTGMPAQTNYGFSLLSGNSITSVSVVAPNKLKIVGASSLVGDTLQYGFGAATGKGAYAGAAGNLRDSQGNCVPTADNAGQFLMHNWCNVFQFAL